MFQILIPFMSLNPIPLSECQPGGSVLNPLLQRFHRLSVSRGRAHQLQVGASRKVLTTSAPQSVSVAQSARQLNRP